MKSNVGSLAGLVCLAAVATLFWAATAPAEWMEVAKITASDGVDGDAFGGAIAFDGSRVMVGTRKKDADTGAAYVYAPNGSGGYAEKRLSPEGLVTGDGFGTHVLLSGDLAFVSGYTADVTVGATTYADAGAVWVFQKDQGGANNWGQIAKLTTSAPLASGRFGSSMAIDGDTLLVGASNEGTNQAGAAYLFHEDEFGVWNQIQKIQPAGTPGTTYRYFGQSCDMDGDTLVVGSYGKNKAYVYENEAGAWVEKKTLTVSGLNPTSTNFGVGTSIEGDTIVVGAYRQKVGTLTDAGSAYVFGRDEGGEENWGQMTTILPYLPNGDPDSQASANFANGTALLGNHLAVTAHNADSTDGALYYYEKDLAGNWVQIEKIANGVADETFGYPIRLAGDYAAVGARAGAGAVYIYAVPEPSALALVLVGLVTLLGMARRKA